MRDALLPEVKKDTGPNLSSMRFVMSCFAMQSHLSFRGALVSGAAQQANNVLVLWRVSNDLAKVRSFTFYEGGIRFMDNLSAKDSEAIIG